MAFETRELSGSLFPNEKKKDGDSRPDLTGRCLIAGKGYWVSSWVKSGQKGKFRTLAFTPMEKQPQQEPGFGEAPSPEMNQAPEQQDETAKFF